MWLMFELPKDTPVTVVASKKNPDWWAGELAYPVTGTLRVRWKSTEMARVVIVGEREATQFYPDQIVLPWMYQPLVWLINTWNNWFGKH